MPACAGSATGMMVAAKTKDTIAGLNLRANGGQCTAHPRRYLPPPQGLRHRLTNVRVAKQFPPPICQRERRRP
jgi:hypothetical protein